MDCDSFRVERKKNIQPAYFSEDHISAPRMFCRLKFLHALKITKTCYRTPTEDEVSLNFLNNKRL